VTAGLSGKAAVAAHRTFVEESPAIPSDKSHNRKRQIHVDGEDVIRETMPTDYNQ
jgi:hypothetical protein